jgi:hypothetical protein
MNVFEFVNASDANRIVVIVVILAVCSALVGVAKAFGRRDRR